MWYVFSILRFKSMSDCIVRSLGTGSFIRWVALDAIGIAGAVMILGIKDAFLCWIAWWGSIFCALQIQE